MSWIRVKFPINLIGVISFKKIILGLTYALFITEIYAAVILLTWFAVVKFIDRPDLRANVLLSSNDLPYGISFLSAGPSKKMPINADPHLIFYPLDLRFGENKYWHDMPPKRDTLNIVMLGGSTIEGDGALNQEGTVASQLGTYLNARRAENCLKVKIINEGTSGYHAKQQYFLLTYALIPHLKPENIDLVINIDGVNDFLGWTSSRTADSFNQFSRFMSTRELEARSVMQEFFIKGKVEQRNWVESFYKSTFSGRLALSLYSSLSTKKKFDVDVFGHHADLSKFEVSITERANNYLYWKKLTDITLSGMGIQSMQVLQPYIGFKKSLTTYEDAIRNADPRFPKIFWTKFDEYYHLVRQEIPDHKFLIDLSTFYANDPESSFVDHVHYTPRAQVNLAAKLGAMISPKLPCKVNIH